MVSGNEITRELLKYFFIRLVMLETINPPLRRFRRTRRDFPELCLCDRKLEQSDERVFYVNGGLGSFIGAADMQHLCAGGGGEGC